MGTLVIRNLPDELRDRLKRQAEQHHRSMNKEAISLIEAGVKVRPSPAELPPPVKLKGGPITIDEIEHAIHEQPGLIAADHNDVLAIAERYGVSAYDARFLAASALLGVPLVTEDAKLRKATPDLCQSLNEALANQETN